MRRSLRAEHDAWQKYKKWQKANIDELRPGQEITSLGEFQEIYRQAGRRIQTIKNEVRFETSAKTYRSFAKAYKEKFGKSIPKVARKLGTRALANMLNEEIKEYSTNEMARLRAQGYSEAEARRLARLAVSRYYFGS